MLTVYKIDDSTRLILPGSQWGFSVLERLRWMGHTVTTTDQDPNTVVRDEAELRRVDEILDSTGF